MVTLRTGEFPVPRRRKRAQAEGLPRERAQEASGRPRARPPDSPAGAKDAGGSRAPGRSRRTGAPALRANSRFREAPDGFARKIPTLAGRRGCGRSVPGLRRVRVRPPQGRRTTGGGAAGHAPPLPSPPPFSARRKPPCASALRSPERASGSACGVRKMRPAEENHGAPSRSVKTLRDRSPGGGCKTPCKA